MGPVGEWVCPNGMAVRRCSPNSGAAIPASTQTAGNFSTAPASTRPIWWPRPSAPPPAASLDVRHDPAG